jgi:hypothetical protein
MLRKHHFTYVFWLLVPFILAACSGQSEADAAAAEAEAAAAEAEEQAGEVTSVAEGLRRAADELDRIAEETEGTEPRDFRELKALLPATLLGLERTEHKGSKTGVAGFQMATAEAEYRDGDKRLSVTIVEGAPMQIAGMTAAWSMIEVDSEEGDKVTRTMEIDGKKAFYEYDSGTRNGQLAVISGQTLITIEGWDIDGDELEEVYQRLDL